MVPVGAAFIEIVRLYPLVYGGFVVHTSELSGSNPSNGMIHHLVFQEVVEQMNLVVVHQHATMVETILQAYQDFHLFGAGVRIEVLPVPELTAAKQVVKKQSQIVLLGELVRLGVEVIQVRLKMWLNRDD